MKGINTPQIIEKTEPCMLATDAGVTTNGKISLNVWRSSWYKCGFVRWQCVN